MAKLGDAAPEDIARLLKLFPAPVLKQNWVHLRAPKEEMCSKIAQEHDLEKISRFVADNYGRCKQHVYLMQPWNKNLPKPETSFPDANLFATDKQKRQLFLAKVRWKVLLANPFEEEQVELLWPMRIDHHKDATLVSFVVVERDIQMFFEGRTILTQRRLVEEQHVVDALLASGLIRLDFNKGTKALWKADKMDAFRSTFKKSRSTTTEAMDRQLGIKRTNPDLYQEMLLLPIHKTMFRVEASLENSVKVFQADPTGGVVRMTRYTEEEGDSDELVYALLAQNS